MNKAILMGRLTKDPEVKYSQSNEPMAIARYSLAVNRRFKRDGEPDADFINVVAFGKQGEFAEKYLQKGKQICVVGSIRTGSYEKDGRKIYTTDIVAEEQYFAESKKSESAPVKDEFDKIDVPTPPSTNFDAPADTKFTPAGDDFSDDDCPF